MAASEFWVPNELALEILGFNKNILEKRITADYIKREIRGGIELLEISGEIERFGLSIDLARDKLDDYINKGSNAIVEKKKVEIEIPKAKPFVSEPSILQAGIPVQPIIPQSVPQLVQAPVIQAKAVDYTPQFNKISQLLDDIRKISVAMPDSIISKTPKETNAINPQIVELKSEFLRLSNLAEQNFGFQKDVVSLQAQLKTAHAEVAKLTAQSNSIMDEMERTNQKYSKEIDSLKNTIKNEMSGLSSLLSLKLRKPKSGLFIILLLMVVCGGVGFIAFELYQPTFSVLAKPNDKVSPLTKKEVETTVNNAISPLEEKIKKMVDSLSIQNKNTQQKDLADINSTITIALEAQKEAIKKTLDSTTQSQKEAKNSLDENYTKSLKSIETQVLELEKLIKKMLETTVQIKPGTKFMPDSNE
jgi:hypothetical protein